VGFGFKYHVATIAAIFFALTVGLIVGGLFVSPRIAVQQTRQIERLRTDVNRDIAITRTEKERDERALAALVPAAIHGRLAGVSATIVQTGDYPEATAGIREALTQADARVVCSLSIAHYMTRPDELLLADLKVKSQVLSGFPSTREELADRIARLIVRGASPADSGFSDLESEGILHLDQGSDTTSGCRLVVIAAGSRSDASDRAARVDALLVKALQKFGASVMMAETVEAHASDVDSYKHLGIPVSTIDNIDTDIGRGSLIFAYGGDPGTFGIKPSAADLFPAELSKQASQ
jgi:Copper transport outer membrane protein, MctB